MNNKAGYNVLELILSILFVGLGIGLSISTSIMYQYISYFMIGFVALKIVLIIARGITFKENLVFVLIQLILNVAIIVLLIVFDEVNALSFVVSASVLADLITNIIRSIFFRKYKNYASATTFFAMENIIYIVFAVLLIINRNSTLAASGVLFGAVILYKGIAMFLNNMFVRVLINKTDFGQAIDKVHALDIFFGLLIIVILAALIFPYIEDSINDPGDALWYCFTLITTIGTGDIVAKTAMGRILSVVIGFYGMVIVSILTSAIVVYLTRDRKKEKDKEKSTKDK